MENIRIVVAPDQNLEQNHLAATKAVSELRAETARLSGAPILIAYGEAVDDALGGLGVQLAWDYKHDYHVVLLQPGEPDMLRPYYVGCALLRIQAEWEARVAGKRRIPNFTDQQRTELIPLLDPPMAGGGRCNVSTGIIALSKTYPRYRDEINPRSPAAPPAFGALSHEPSARPASSWGQPLSQRH